MQIKRIDRDGSYHIAGDYVRYLDVEKLEGSKAALLEALEALADSYVSISVMHDYAPQQNPHYLNAIAAIKQAKGETPELFPGTMDSLNKLTIRGE